LFHMYRKVEAARALARRAMLYNFTQPVPALALRNATNAWSMNNSASGGNLALNSGQIGYASGNPTNTVGGGQNQKSDNASATQSDGPGSAKTEPQTPCP
ncbi:MAG: hypothetical protein ABSA97_16395, partial [Verrucomicrobiia bacterium]